MMPRFVPLTALMLACVVWPSAGQGHDHAAMAMGFDQDATAHHFMLYADGGAIDVSVRDPADVRNLDAIRMHLRHVSQKFSEGDFVLPMLVHDRTDVPGTAEMAALKDQIHYRYADTARGGRVDIVTADPAALAAIHRFLRFQIDDHHTGDSLAVRLR